MINDTIWSILLSDLTQLLFFFITNYPIKKPSSEQISLNQEYQKKTNILQVINSQLINTSKK